MVKYSVISPRKRSSLAARSSGVGVDAGGSSSSSSSGGWFSKAFVAFKSAIERPKTSSNAENASSSDQSQNNVFPNSNYQINNNSFGGGGGGNIPGGNFKASTASATGETPALVRRGRNLMQKLEERERLGNNNSAGAGAGVIVQPRVLRSALKSSRNNNTHSYSSSNSSTLSMKKSDESDATAETKAGIIDSITSVAPYVYMEVVSKWDNFSILGSKPKPRSNDTLFGSVLDWFGSGLDDKNNAFNSEARTADSPYPNNNASFPMSGSNNMFSHSHSQSHPFNNFSKTSTSAASTYEQQAGGFEPLVRPLPGTSTINSGSTFSFPSHNNSNNNVNIKINPRNYNRYNGDNVNNEDDDLLNMSSTTATNTAMNGGVRGGRRNSKSRLSIGTSEFIHDIVGQDGPDINLYPTKLQFSAKKGASFGNNGVGAWICSGCTFENKAVAKKCGVCLNFRVTSQRGAHGNEVDDGLDASRHVKWGENEILEISMRNDKSSGNINTGAASFGSSHTNVFNSNSNSNSNIGTGRFDSFDTQNTGSFRSNGLNSNMNHVPPQGRNNEIPCPRGNNMGSHSTYDGNMFNSFNPTSVHANASTSNTSFPPSSVGASSSSSSSSFEAKGPITLSSVKRRLANKPTLGATNTGVSATSSGISVPLGHGNSASVNSNPTITLSSIKRRQAARSNNITAAPINRSTANVGNYQSETSQPKIEVDIYSSREANRFGGLSNASNSAPFSSANGRAGMNVNQAKPESNFQSGIPRPAASSSFPAPADSYVNKGLNQNKQNVYSNGYGSNNENVSNVGNIGFSANIQQKAQQKNAALQERLQNMQSMPKYNHI